MKITIWFFCRMFIHLIHNYYRIQQGLIKMYHDDPFLLLSFISI